MTKKVTAASLGLPKGIRLNDGTKERIVAAALESSFGEEALRLIDAELDFANCLREELIPGTLAVEYQRTMRALIGQQVMSCTEQGLLCYSDDRSLKLDMGGELWRFCSTWNYSPAEGGLSSAVCDAAGISRVQLHELCTLFYLPEPLSRGLAHITVPAHMQQRAAELKRWELELTEKVSETKGLVQRQLDKYKSPLQLCIDAPMFLPWILAAEGIDKVGRCSDIPEVDDLCRLSQLTSGKSLEGPLDEEPHYCVQCVQFDRGHCQQFNSELEAHELKSSTDCMYWRKKV